MTDLEEVANDMLRQMYNEAEPPRDYDELLENPEEAEDEWYQNHYLDGDRVQEIFDEHCEKHNITESERTPLSIHVIMGASPTSNKELVEGVE